MRWTLLLLTLQGPAPSSAVVRGVAPELQSRYAGALRCGGTEVEPSAINDDYCDCEDGSDEPGTGACAGQEATLFHCANVGSVPQLVYASRVGDGICDCCDGSDEAHLPQSGCLDSCREQGEKQVLEREMKLKELSEGLLVKRKTIEKALEEKEQKEKELSRVQAELPDLEARLAELRKKKDEADAVRMEAECKTELPRLRAKVKELEEKVARLEEAKSETTTTTTKKVVSEYAKWMDGADALEAEAEEAPEAPEEQETMGPEELPPAPPPSEEDPLEKGLRELEATMKSTKELKSKLEKEINELPEDKMGFASLRDKCLEFKTSEYTYKLCFFKDAKQSFTRLGSWEGFTSPTEAVFKNGDMCYGGPARSLTVTFECGAEEVISLDEPSRCSYGAVVRHSGACSESMKADLESPRTRHPKEEL